MPTRFFRFLSCVLLLGTSPVRYSGFVGARRWSEMMHIGTKAGWWSSFEGSRSSEQDLIYFVASLGARSVRARSVLLSRNKEAF